MVVCRANDARNYSCLIFPELMHCSPLCIVSPKAMLLFSVSWNVRKLLELLSDPIKVSVQKQKP